MLLEEVSLDELVPDPDNVRDHPEENLRAIEDSLKRFGQAAPLVVHEGTNVVVGGNGTLRALKRLGKERAHIVRYSGSLSEAKALSIALNRTAELASWNAENLAQALLELNDEVSHEELGFSVESLEAMFPEPKETFRVDPKDPDAEDEAPAPEVKKEIQYTFIFDTPEQQNRFFAFLRWLKSNDDEGETHAERLDTYLRGVL